MALGYSDLFTKLGKAFHAANTANTAVGTTVEDEVEDYVQEYDSSDPIEVQRVTSGLLEALRAFQSSASSINATLASSARQLLVELVAIDNPQLDRDEQTALDELIRQMEADDESLDASTVTVTITADSDNAGNGVFVFSPRRPDGKVQEHSYGEDVVAVCDSNGPDAAFSLSGEAAQSDKMAYDWPQGSGASLSIAAVNALSGTNLVPNPRFTEQADDATNLPEDWIAPVATLGTTLKLSSVEIQTVAISGTPTAGWYVLTFSDVNGDSHSTYPLPYNASGDAVQTALRLLPTLDEVTVSTAGTSPNYTHTITFTGVPNPSQLTSTSGLTGGTPAIAHNTSTAGSARTFKGARTLEFDSNGSQLTTIQAAVAVEPLTQYAVNLYAITDSAPAAGVFTIDLVDGVGGTVLRDESGFQNTVQFSATALTTSHQSLDALVSGANEVQEVSIVGSPTGGTFTLSFDGQTTGNIAYNASAGDVQTALVALTNIGTGNVSCGGGPLPGSAVTVTFQNKLARRNVPSITGDATNLTGGFGVAVAVSTTTEGNPDYAVFRTPAVLPNQVYLRIRITTAVSNTSSVFLNEVVLAPMSQLYAGGPYVAIFDGATEWALEDRVTVAVANDRAGALHEWCHRIWDLGENEKLIPTNASGAETRADSLIG